MKWNNLSNEIKLEVIKRLPRDELKSIRLACKATCQLATPVLFSHVVLRPSMISVTRLQKISWRPDLALLVRTLESHPLGLVQRFVEREVHENEWSEEAGSVFGLPNGFDLLEYDFEYARLCSRLHLNYMDEIAAQRKFEEFPSRVLLQKILTAFNGLRSIIWRERGPDGSEDTGNDEVTLPYRHALYLRTGIITATSQIDFTFLHLLQSCPICPNLNEMTALDISWPPFGSARDEYLSDHPSLGSLRKLHLTFDASLLLRNPKSITQLEWLLVQLRELQDLRFGFTRTEDIVEQTVLPRIWSYLLSRRCSGLQKLRLDHIHATEKTILGFLKTHSKTLKSLTIDSMKITSPANQATNTVHTREMSNSILRAIWSLRHVMQLQEIHFGGTFIDDRWSIEIEPLVPDCFRSRVEEYVCKRGPFPFPGFEELTEEQACRALSNDKADWQGLGPFIEGWHRSLESVGRNNGVADDSWFFTDRFHFDRVM
ncbi:hypothetical protein H2200_003161 [Cladophialophora chaetospira]|uniref:F-box domain-containing protein n=1 Tax=Cladophialophora chaetospira TaxID=386627 RepID=A0AA39CL70_9EURO|nr:hypothetical protein H2200_003161 [Cladophialophora chaetospira]